MKKPHCTSKMSVKLALPQRNSIFLYRVLLFCVIGVFGVAQAQIFPYSYRYISLKDKAPTGFGNFRPVAINDKLQIAATVAKCSGTVCTDYVARYEKNATVRVFKKQPANAKDINNAGVIIGSNYPMPGQTINYLFDNREIKAINEFKSSTILGFNTSSNAYQVEYSVKGINYLLHSNNADAKIDFAINHIAPDYSSHFAMKNSFLSNMNSVAGLSDNQDGSASLFRFDTKAQKVALSSPIPAKRAPIVLGINNKNDVLGVWQLSNSNPRHIVIWGNNGQFIVYNTLTNGASYLVFNDNRLIVEAIPFAESTSFPERCFLLPKPNVRLELANLVTNLPANAKLLGIYDMNNVGDMIGYGRNQEMFLLQRIDGKWGKRFQ